MAEPSLLDQLLIEDDDDADVPAATPASSRSDGARGDDDSNPDDDATDDDDDNDNDNDEDGADEDGDGEQEDDMDLDLEAELEAELGDADAMPEPGTAEASQGFTPQPTPAMTAATATPGTAVPSAPGEDTGAAADGQVGEDDLDDDDEDYDVASVSAHMDVAHAGDDEDGGGVSALPQEFLDRQNAARDVAGTDGDASTSYGPDEKTRKQHEMGIVGQLDSLQSERYELYRRSKLKPASMKKVVEAVAGRSVNANVVTAMCGVAKMYVGEVVETARSIATRAGHHGALWPRHIIEAHEVLQQQQQWPGPAPRRPGRLFR